MGCGSSKAANVIEPSDCNIKTSGKGLNLKNSKTSLQTERNDNLNRPDESGTDLNDNFAKPREISASSTRTADSGVSEVLGEIITENSSKDKLELHGVSQRPKTPDLILEGVACPRKQSGKERRMLELQRKDSDSVAKLPPPPCGSLLERPKTRGGMAFDITFCPETGNIKKAQLPRLELRKKKRKLTKEELEEKMRRATERRKEHNKRIQEKSHAFVQQYESGSLRRHNNMKESNNEEKNKDIPTGDDAVETIEKAPEGQSL